MNVDAFDALGPLAQLFLDVEAERLRIEWRLHVSDMGERIGAIMNISTRKNVPFRMFNIDTNYIEKNIS